MASACSTKLPPPRATLRLPPTAGRANMSVRSIGLSGLRASRALYRHSACAVLRAPATSLPAGHLPHRLSPSAPHSPVRAMATGGRGDDDKSWSEIAGEAAGALKSAAKKAGNSLQKALGQDEATKLERQRRKEHEEMQKAPDLGQVFGGGLVGRMAGAMLGSALKGLGEQMEKAGREAASIQNQARDAIEADRRVVEALGGSVQVGGPISQSSMSSSINGRTTKQVSLILPVMGQRGVAQAQVEASEGEEGISQLKIQVRLPSGETVSVDGSGGVGGGSSGGSGRVIDAEWREL
mmetsp:Transcript_27085/g.48278  ORF Transcript_27085/g.48278 Transcript_27085/m.48278 type:complete len:295 (-) Transcript_27085:170-1054(-)